MQVQQNVSLKQYNTFGIDVAASQFATFSDLEELKELANASSASRQLILGGGSNMLFTGDFTGWVLKNDIKGVKVVNETEEFVYVQAGAGENWHQLVQHCVNQGWAGLENLSLIPGNVGASPMQNIGAYGVEVKDLIQEVQAWHIGEQQLVSFTNEACEFGYRESVFKHKYKNQFVILQVTYRLRKHPVFHTSYGAIQKELELMGVQELSIRAVAEAVIRIRSSKLPDPSKLGNAGSFFKNPSVIKEKMEQLKVDFPTIPAYENADGSWKLAAGWLIEQCGWKGFRSGDAGCHAQQALVLVNYGGATGKEIFQLSEEILQSVVEKFGVLLEREVNIID
jgi:UDP-N-acetylmuramate dehydrogenase